MQIIPALLEKDIVGLSTQIKKLSPYFRHFQIDIADGIFVPNKTVQLNDIALASKQWNKKIIDALTFDFHLMVKDYKAEIKQLETLRNYIVVKNVFIHFSLHPDIQYLLSNHLFNFGLVLNPDDSVDQLVKIYKLTAISSIQIMSVNPGFQGSPFIQSTLNKIAELRSKAYKGDIFLDGSINNETLPIINVLQYKPDYLCIGSFITKSQDLRKSINELHV